MVVFALFISLALASQIPLQYRTHYDVQAHRGGRGNTIENTIPSFAWGLIDGATTLELDCGLTKDDVVVVWHDESIEPTKCVDTAPAFPGDASFPYVGKFVANLTLAQLKTLDCSKRQTDFPVQLTYPGTKISTLEQVFEFVQCADPERRIQWNIESKINAQFPDRTRSVSDFVKYLHQAFVVSQYRHSITFQSFDWRSLVAMKALDPFIVTSALIAPETATMPDNSTSPWLAGLRLDSFPGQTIGEQIAEASHAIRADIVSPEDVVQVARCPTPQYMPFTSRSLVRRAHELGLLVKPWTVNRLDRVEELLDWGVDGIISDFPNSVRRRVQQYGHAVAPKYPKKRVLECLNNHLERHVDASSGS